MVLYTWSQAQDKKYDPGFGKEVEWDIPLLEGYNYTFVNNVSKNPNSNHFYGIVNPTLINEVKERNQMRFLLSDGIFRAHFKSNTRF